MTVHELEVTRPATTLQTVNFTRIDGSPNPGRVQALTVTKAGFPQTVNLSPVVNNSNEDS